MSEYYLDLWTWLNSVQMRTLTGSRWTSNNYITRCHRRIEVVGIRVSVPVGDKMPEWEPAPDSGLGSSANQNAKEMLLWSEELGVNMWQPPSISNSPLTYHKHQAYRIKCEGYIFIKKCVRSFTEVDIIVDNVSACICIIYMYTYSCMWLYNIWYEAIWDWTQDLTSNNRQNLIWYKT